MQIIHATELYNLGFSLFPVATDRVPLKKWKRLQKQRLSLMEVTNRCIKYRNCNLGIVTGKISNLYVVDFDTEDSLVEFQKHGELPKTVVVKTGRGYHYYFKPSTTVHRNCTKFFPGIDFRGEGGFAMSPWSKHPSGVQYSWIVSPEEQEIAVIPEWIESLIIAHKERVKSKKKKKISKIKQAKAGSTIDRQLYQPSPLRAYQISFNKALRNLKKRNPNVVIKRGISGSSHNKGFNKMFPNRTNGIPYIIWDQENEKRKNAGLDFHITYGIMINNSANRLKQFGIQIEHFLKKQEVEFSHNVNCPGRIRIIIPITNSLAFQTHQDAPGLMI
jgi:hypothetical protein